MNCEHCRDDLLDLLDRNVPDTRASELRDHLDHCAGCRSHYAALQAGLRWAEKLPALEVPSHLEHRILAATRARARELAAEKKTESTGTPGSRLMHWLGSLLLAPQAAMVTLLFLAVGVGLWYLPHGWRSPEHGEGGTLVDPDYGGEVGPTSGGPAPEQRAEEWAPRTPRAAAAPSVADPAPALSITPLEKAPAKERELEDSQATPTTRFADRLGDEDRFAQPPRSDSERVSADDALGGLAASGRAERDAPAPPAERRPPPEEEQFEASRRFAEAPMDLGDTRQPVTAEPAAPAEPQATPAQRPSRTTTPAASSEPRAHAQTAPRAPPAPEQNAGQDRAGPGGSGSVALAGGSVASESQSNRQRRQNSTNVLNQARSLRNADRCAEAVSFYERALRERNVSPQAMLELAQCYRALGRIAEARRWADRAAEYPNTAAAAARLRMQLGE